MVQDTGEEMLRRFAQIHFLAGAVGRRPAGLVPQAHMNMHAVADEIGIGLWRKDHAMAEAVRHGPRHLASDHRMVGGDQGRLRRHRHLELARPIFGEKTVRDRPGGPQSGGEGLAEITLSAKGAECVGIARAVVVPV